MRIYIEDHFERWTRVRNFVFNYGLAGFLIAKDRTFLPQQLMGNLVMGAHGAVGTLYNFMPQVFHRLLRHLSNGEMEKAREEQIRAQKVLKLMIKHGHSVGGNVAAVKPMMALVGLDLGPPRHPMRPMTVDELMDFHKDVDLIGFKDWEPAILM